MAGTDYTDKQHEEHVANWRKDRTFPPNSVFDPQLGDGRLFRKATPDELAAIGPQPAPDAAKSGEEE